MFKKLFIMLSIVITSYVHVQAHAVELVVGEERISPGVVMIFEGAVKDQVMPMSLHLSEKETNVHIEARANWATKGAPKGAPGGGFVAYLRVTAKVTHQKTGFSTFVDLLPHINLIDNLHYARNIALPGAISDLYTVKFTVLAPSQTDLALHKDWLDSHGKTLMQDAVFEYQDVNFEEIAQASRR